MLRDWEKRNAEDLPVSISLVWSDFKDRVTDRSFGFLNTKTCWLEEPLNALLSKYSIIYTTSAKL